MSVTKTLLALCVAAAGSAAHADYEFGNISINALEWSQDTKTRTQAGPFGAKRDFQYLEAEGGFGRSWGDMYGFFDIENWNKNHPEIPAGDRRYTTKLVTRINLFSVADVPVKLYTHIYDTRGDSFFDQSRVLGLGTDLSLGPIWMKPFIGAHQELQSNKGAHMNGYMAGFVVGYPFELFGQKFSLIQWHETEFLRSEPFMTLATPTGVEQHRTGHNGAVGLWWTPVKAVTTGVQYRYAVNKLGVSGNENALIYSVKYNFL